jgi:lysophospholipase L1-like esterase
MRASGMVPTIVLVGLLVTLSRLTGCQKAAPATPASPAQFLALGDSYTIGESVEPADRWPAQLVRWLRDDAGIDLGEPKIIARTGWTTSDLAFAVDVENPSGPFRLVSLLIGVNNQFRNSSIDQFHAQFADLLVRAIGLAGNKPGHVIVLSIPDWGQTPYAQHVDREQIAREIDQFNAVCRQECERKGAAFVDVTTISRQAGSDPSLVAADGLHPSAKMYQRWVEKMLPAVSAALANK